MYDKFYCTLKLVHGTLAYHFSGWAGRGEVALKVNEPESARYLVQNLEVLYIYEYMTSSTVP